MSPRYEVFGEEVSIIQRYRDKAQSVVDELITENMSDRKKAKVLHDWIITHASYSYAYDDEIGLLIYECGNCESYTKTYQLLLNLAGVENRTLDGFNRADWVGHTWNQVKIGNIWYHVDCTWDDPTGGAPGPISGLERDDYFMLSSEKTMKDHYWDGCETDFTGWKKEDGGLVYYDDSFSRVKGWIHVDGNTFCFDENGLNVLNSIVIDGFEFSFNPVAVLWSEGEPLYAGALAPLSSNDLILPEALTRIESEAFANIQHKIVSIPDSVSFIADDAFDASVLILCSEGSYAHTRCTEIGLSVCPCQ